jgi:UDP-N-acetylmuramate dehydrogenase
MKEKIEKIIEICQKDNTCALDVRYDEPMKEHTTFKVGGKADCFLRASGENFPYFLMSLLSNAKKEEVPVFILGGGANVVVSDNGIRGIVLSSGAWKGSFAEGGQLHFKSGNTMDETADFAAELGFTGLEFLAGMPGTIGGALFMNARCYGSEIADVLSWAELIDFGGEPEIKLVPADKNDFGYKLSPFQGKDNFILTAAFKLKQGDKEEIKNKMASYRKDRKDKGHYLFPCAGSAFKNNHAFGKPTGLIIDELGLKGFSIGGAQIAPFHGNIVINTGNATASDIKKLMDEIGRKVKEKTGFTLEPEILFIG